MRWKLYCHCVRSEDDGRRTAYLSHGEGAAATQITITAPFEAFDEDEEPRTAFEFICKFTRVDEKEQTP